MPMLFLLASTVTAVFASWPRQDSPAIKPSEPLQLTIALPAGQRFTHTGRHLVALSPDGTRLVYDEQLDALAAYQLALGRQEDFDLPAKLGETTSSKPRGPS